MLASRAVTAPRAINLPLTLLQTNPVAGYLVLSESGMLSVGSDWIRPDSRPRIPDPPAAVISLRMPVVSGLGAPTAFCTAATVEPSELWLPVSVTFRASTWVRFWPSLFRPSCAHPLPHDAGA